MKSEMKAAFVSLAAALLVVAGCATTQTGGTGGGPASDYETAVMKAIEDIYPGLELTEFKVNPPAPVEGKEGVDGGVATFTVTDGADITEYLYSYEILDGNVSLERKVIKKK